MAKNNQKGLGRGLGALFSEPETPLTAPEQSQTLPIQKLEPNRNQPRREFDPEALQELSDSIAQHGILQPIAVRPLESGYYQIIAGERRWRAARDAGLKEVPVHILSVGDQEAAELALIENLQREDLNPMEEARGFEALMNEYKMTQEEAAQRVGKSRPAVANALRLLKLPKSIISLVEDGSLSAGHARALIPLEDEQLQRQAAGRVIQQQLSVRQTEALVKRLTKPEPEEKPVDVLKVDYYKECEKALSKALGRKVSIQPGKKKGKFTIEYYGDEDLQTLMDALEKM
ncbi:MAG: ParB/RepB/Spo0J family partition protein [Oscillospiraceae bacterium]|nr:ParB/RepB/Spo0J family partition protein [Oscillospiraceae bacterium]